MNMRTLPWIALSMAACTSLDHFDAQSPELPFEREAPRWQVDGASISLGWRDTPAGRRLRFATQLSPHPGGCETCDLDRDGLADLWELALLDRLRPIVRFTAYEQLFIDPVARADSPGRVWMTGGGELRVAIVLRYSRDYGRCTFTEHHGDTERVAFALAPAPDEPGAWDVRAVYTAAHEYSPTDSSAITSGSELEHLTFVTDRVTGDDRWVIVAAENKHASYTSPAACVAFSSSACFAEGCPTDLVVDEHALLLPVFNAGEPSVPESQWQLPGPLGANRWSTMDLWAARPFCGHEDVLGAACAGSVRSKLEIDPF